jgi:uncharacterized protein
MLKRGEIDANVLIAGKPTGSTSRIKASDGFKILPVAYEKALQDDFLPAVLTHEDYPDLIAKGEKIDTVAVSCVLIAYNWDKGTDRYQRISRFVEAFFPRIADFQKRSRAIRNGKRPISPPSSPGWKRHDAAEEWLAKNRMPAVSNERQQFDAYMTAQRGPRRQPTLSHRRSASGCSKIFSNGGRRASASSESRQGPFVRSSQSRQWRHP